MQHKIKAIFVEVTGATRGDFLVYLGNMLTSAMYRTDVQAILDGYTPVHCQRQSYDEILENPVYKLYTGNLNALPNHLEKIACT